MKDDEARAEPRRTSVRVEEEVVRAVDRKLVRRRIRTVVRAVEELAFETLPLTARGGRAATSR